MVNQCQYFVNDFHQCARTTKNGTQYCWQHVQKIQQTGGNLRYECGQSESPIISEICSEVPRGSYNNVLQCVQQCKKKMKGVVTKVIAFDFDLTMTSKHTIAEKITSEMIESMFLHQIFRLASPLFQDEAFLQTLKIFEAQKYRLVVTSYGYPDVITAFLKRIGLYPLIDLILTPSSFGLLDGYDQTNNLNGKNTMLNFLEGVYYVDRSNILLIDDSNTNVLRANRDGYHAIRCQSTGATLTDFKQMQNFRFLKR